MAEIACPLREAGQISAEGPALIQGSTQLHYDELDLMVSATARRLQIAGCGKGERVAILMPNNWQQIVIVYALFRLCSVAVPISSRLPAPAIRRRIDQVGALKLIAHVEGEGVKELDGIDIFRPADLVETQFGEGHAGMSDRIDLGQEATIVFTSGSTGESKAVLHTYGNHYYSARGVDLHFRLRSGDSWMISLPLYHVGGLAIPMRCVGSGAVMILPKRGEDLAEAIKRTTPQCISLVSTQFRRLLSEPAVVEILKGMKGILLGGGAVPAALLEEASALGVYPYVTYGLTEMASQVTTMTRAQTRAGFGSGEVLKYREVQVDDSGEILVRGETLFSGYVNGSAIEAAVDAGGWFHTGDLGSIDDMGNLQIVGRKDNMFVSGGENIHPEIIEQKLLGIERIEEAIVVPVDDDEFGARPAAFVRSDGEWTPDEWSKILESELPRFMLPVRYIEWPEGSGGLKPSRGALREVAG